MLGAKDQKTMGFCTASHTPNRGTDEGSSPVSGIYFTSYIGSYMSAHVLLNVLNELEKRDKMRGLSSILPLFTSLIYSIIHEHEC